MESKQAGTLFIVRDALKQSNAAELKNFQQEMLRSHKERTARWTDKLQDSPLGVDLWQEDLKKYNANRVKDKTEKLNAYLAQKKIREAHSTVLAKATTEPDELEVLRN